MSGEERSGLPAVTGPPSPAEWRSMRDQAQVIAQSGLAPSSVRSPEQILTIALKGRELAVPPMQALSHIHVVEGKPTLSAELMVALVQRAGHKVRVVETTDETATVEAVRRDDPDFTHKVTYTMADAQRAGVAGKRNWKQHPAAMLRARAISALCRMAFADVLMGASYTPEELDADVDVADDGTIVVEAAQPAPEPAPELTDLQAKVRDAMADLADDQIATLKGLWDESVVPKRFSAMSDEQAAQALAWVDEATAPPFDPPSAAQQSEAKELLTKLDVLDDEFVPATWLDAGFGVQEVGHVETRQDMDRAIGKLRELVAKAEATS